MLRVSVIAHTYVFRRNTDIDQFRQFLHAEFSQKPNTVAKVVKVRIFPVQSFAWTLAQYCCLFLFSLLNMMIFNANVKEGRLDGRKYKIGSRISKMSRYFKLLNVEENSAVHTVHDKDKS